MKQQIIVHCPTNLIIQVLVSVCQCVYMKAFYSTHISLQSILYLHLSIVNPDETNKQKLTWPFVDKDSYKTAHFKRIENVFMLHS